MDPAGKLVSAHALLMSRQCLFNTSNAVLGALKQTQRRAISRVAFHEPRRRRKSFSRTAQTISSTPVRSFQTSSRSLSAPQFRYGIAASFTAKDTRYNPSKHLYNFHPETKHSEKGKKDKKDRFDSGQDAFFISKIDTTGDVAFGVADGVGGWVDSGVDPADFSHALCSYMAHAAATQSAGPKISSLTAQSLLQSGYDQVVGDTSIAAGGSTACIGIAREDGTLDVANLGDSGFLQLRLNAVHHYSEPQTHAFNTPYQLSVIPERMRARTAAFGGVQLQDFPKDAAVSEHDLRHGDVLVFATDGVWDNLSSSDILRVVSRLMVGARAWEHTDDGISVTERLGVFTQLGGDKEEPSILSLQSFLAVGITSEAKAASVNTRRDGPFAREVKKYYPEEDWRGGKVDDICTVVVVVVEEGK